MEWVKNTLNRIRSISIDLTSKNWSKQEIPELTEQEEKLLEESSGPKM